jgi:small subunit ribosomal protein S12
MSTINQLIRDPRKREEKSKRNLGAPQRRGTCLKVMKKTPKKPNSALRSCARLILLEKFYRPGEKKKKNLQIMKKEITVYIPGEGHNAQEFSSILTQGGGAKDLIGVRRSVVRGAFGFDVEGVKGRQQGRSKYGTKKIKQK